MGHVADDRPVRVLIADDADDLRLLLRITLESDERFQVIAEAGDGGEVLQQAAELRPDAIVLDLSMPVMDGLEVLPLLRRELPDCSIVVLTGLDADLAGKQAMELGASGYIEKGEDLRRLRDMLGGALAP